MNDKEAVRVNESDKARKGINGGTAPGVEAVPLPTRMSAFGGTRLVVLGLLMFLTLGIVGGAVAWKAWKSGAFGAASSEAAKTNGREVEYYTCSMHPYIREDKPGNCPVCGMKLQAVYKSGPGAAAGSDSPGTVHISVEEARLLGIRTTLVKSGSLTTTVRAPGRVEVNEEKLHHVHPKIEGWVEELFVKTVGEEVRAGDPLFSIYSPQLVAAQEEYLVALRSREALAGATSEATAGIDRLISASRDRFRLWDVPEDEVRELERTRRVQRALTLRAHIGGFVMNRGVAAGQKVMPGDDLYVVADLSTVWIIADISERDISRISVGQRVSARFAGRPGKTFGGVVTYIYPYLDETTRTVRLRVQIVNDGLLLKPGMFGEIEIGGPSAETRLLAPVDAVMITGERNLVFVESAPGAFTPVEVKLGEAGGGYYEILEGLKEGDTIVERGAFFLDSESKLRMTGGAGAHAGHGEPAPAAGASAAGATSRPAQEGAASRPASAGPASRPAADPHAGH
jgi:Cu(I)/Ag(I) efflux system membrane fusion protein